jgi:hypothetical protein
MKKRISKKFAAIAIALAGVATALAIGMSMVPASAFVATGNITEFNGNLYNLNSTNFNYGSTLVDSTGARTICAPSAGTTGIVQLCGASRPDNDRCIVADSANSYILHIGHCNAIGSLWLNLDNGDGSRELVNNHYTNRHMSSSNGPGDPWAALPTNNPGWYHRLDPIQ